MSLPDFARLTATTRAEVPTALFSDVKDHLRITGTDDDTYILALISAATAYIGGRGILGRAIVQQTWKQVEQSPSGRVDLLMKPAQSLTSIQYYDADNVLQTDTLGNYQLIAGNSWGYVEPTEGNTWPATYSRPDAVQITFTAGADDSGESIEDNVRHAINLLVGHWYQNREDSTFAAPHKLTHGVDNLLSITRENWYG